MSSAFGVAVPLRRTISGISTKSDKVREPHRAGLRHAAEVKAVEAIIATSGMSPCRSHSAPDPNGLQQSSSEEAFPTDQAERAKALEKERKAKGIVKAKSKARAKPVEQVFDDCGSVQ